MGDIWFMGDFHFGHENIIKYCDRPFKNAKEMNETLIENWNYFVKPDEQAYILGDFGFGKKEDIILWGKALNGHKTLVLGNHDRATMKTYYDAGFDFVSKHPLLLDEFFILSHCPQNITPDGRYANIFAHVHNNPMYRTVTPRSHCVSAECVNYFPVSFDVIKNRMENCHPVIDQPIVIEVPKVEHESKPLCKYWLHGDITDYCTAEEVPCGCLGDKNKCKLHVSD